MPFSTSGSTSGTRLEVWGAMFGWTEPQSGPSQGNRGWRQEAACQELPTDMFFPIGHGPRAEAQIKLAKEVCNACPVRAQCLDYALAANTRYGVFGGLAEDERREVRRRRAGRFGLDDADLEESA